MSTAAALLIQAAGALFVAYLVLLLITAVVGRLVGRRGRLADVHAGSATPMPAASSTPRGSRATVVSGGTR